MTHKFFRLTHAWHTSSSDWHAHDTQVHHIDTRRTHKFIRLTHAGHTNSSDWHTHVTHKFFRLTHACDTQVLQIDTCVTHKFFKLTHAWHTNSSDWHTRDTQVLQIDTGMYVRVSNLQQFACVQFTSCPCVNYGPNTYFFPTIVGEACSIRLVADQQIEKSKWKKCFFPYKEIFLTNRG